MEFDAIATLTANPEWDGCKGLALSMLQANDVVIQAAWYEHKQ